MRDKKSTIALVFAGGVASQFQDGDVAPLKALLPVGGQPIANYVLRALEQSQVEKIFIIQDEETSLEEALSASDKCVFVRRDRHHRSLASSMKFGIKKAAAYYGPTLIQQKSILFVPCDLPLANKDNFNALIQQAAEKDADVLLTFISENLVKRRFPQKIRFRSAYAADLKERYTIQMVGFLNGGIIQCDPSGGPEIATINFSGVDPKKVIQLRETMDFAREHQDHNYHLPRFTDKFAIRWIFRKGYMTYVTKFIFNLILNKLTMEKLMGYFCTALDAKIGYLLSKEVELSGDIDRPEDYQIVLGIPWENHKAGQTASAKMGEA